MNKLYARDYCPNGIEAIALLLSLNYKPEIFDVGGTYFQHHASDVKSISEEEFTIQFPKVTVFPFAILDGIHLEGLPAIRKYVSIEH